MRIISVTVKLALSLCIVAVLCYGAIWLVSPSFAVTLAEKNMQGVSDKSAQNSESPDKPKECEINPDNPNVQECSSGTTKCGSGNSYTCCGPKESCCVKSDGSHFCSDGRCPN